jgi:hypothetical protein
MPTVPFRCVECRAEFPPQGGGHCAKCGRLLCLRHLFGVLGKLAAEPDERVCVQCRSQAAQAAGQGPTGREL